MTNKDQEFPKDRDLSQVPQEELVLDALVREIHQLEVTIRQLLQSATQTLGLAFVVAGFATALTKDVSRTIALSILPAFFGLTVMYHLNASAEAAALAELRDRLSIRANRALGSRVFATRIVSDFRRASRGTAGAFVLAGSILIGSMVAGLVNVFSGHHSIWFKVLQLVVTGIVFFGCLLAALDIPKARYDVNWGLDRYYGESSRPETAPKAAGFWSLVRSSIYGRPKR